MLHIAYSTLKHHKRITAFYFILLLLVFTLMLTVLPLFNGMIDSIADAGAAKYGTHDIILYNLTEEQFDDLHRQNVLTKMGAVDTYGSWQLADKGEDGNAITLGCFDDTAWSISSIRLAEGRLPKTENEIALEQSVRYRLGIDFTVGDTITLIQNDTQKTFTICGILRNYTNTWEVVQTTTLVPGHNDMPNAIVLPQEQPAVHNLHALCYTDGLGGNLAWTALEQSIDSSGTGLYHFIVLQNQLKPLKSFRTLFLVVILFGIILCINTALSLYIETYQPTFQTMYNLGAESKHPFILFSIQQAILMVSAVICSLPLSNLIILLAQKLMHNNIPFRIFTSGNLLLIVVVFILLCALILYRFRNIHTLKKQSISQKSRKRTRQMQISGSLSWSFAVHFMDTTLKKVIPIIVLVAFLFSATSFTNVYITDFLESNVYRSLEEQNSELRFYDFTLETARGHAMMPYETVNLYLNKGRVLPPQLIDDFYALSGVEYVYIYMFGTNQATLLLPVGGDFYWSRFDATMYKYLEDDFTSDMVPGVPQDVFSSSYVFYVLDDALIPALKEAYPDMASDIDTLGKDEVIAILPPMESGATNKLLTPGYILNFAELTYTNDDFFEVVAHPETITYTEHHLTVKSIYDKQFNVSINDRRQKNTSPTFLISKETFYTNDLFKGIEYVEIFLDPNISEQDYAAVEQLVMDYGSSMNDVSVYSRRAEEEQDRQFMAVTSTALAIMLSTLGLFVVFCLFVTLYMALLHRKHSLSIMRSLGMKRWTLAKAIFMEVSGYMIYCVLISLLIYFVIMYLFFKEIFWTSISLINTLTMLSTAGISLAVTLSASAIIVHFLLNTLYKESISAAMRTAE